MKERAARKETEYDRWVHHVSQQTEDMHLSDEEYDDEEDDDDYSAGEDDESIKSHLNPQDESSIRAERRVKGHRTKVHSTRSQLRKQGGRKTRTNKKGSRKMDWSADDNSGSMARRQE